MTDIKDVRQRADLALTMDRLSRYVTVADRGDVLRVELRQALAEWFDLDVPVLDHNALFGDGVGWAITGQPLKGDIRGPEAQREAFFANGMDVVEKLEELTDSGWTFLDRDRYPFKEALIMAALHDAAEFTILRGPRPEDEAALERLGYEPQAARDVIETNARREQDLAQMLEDGRASKAKIDDMIAARLYVWDLADLLPSALSSLGLTAGDFLSAGRAGLQGVLDLMPSMVVEQALRRANFRNGSYTWSTNDIRDLAMLGRAVPYCDVTVTEKHAASVLNAAHVPARLGTVVLRRISDLVPHVDGWMA